MRPQNSNLAIHALAPLTPARSWCATIVETHHQTLKRKGLAFQPDLVLLNVASNNLGLPQYIRVAEDPFDLSTCFLFDFVRSARAGLERAAVERGVLGRVTRRELSWGPYVTTDPERIPPQFRGLVGWDPFHRAMDELAQLSAAHGFEVVVFATLDVDLVTPMLKAARERGFLVVTLTDEIIEHLRERGCEELSIERYLASELVVSPSNAHPSPLQHRMAAERLIAELEASGTIDRLLLRP